MSQVKSFPRHNWNSGIHRATLLRTAFWYRRTQAEPFSDKAAGVPKNLMARLSTGSLMGAMGSILGDLSSAHKRERHRLLQGNNREQFDC